MGDGPTWTLTRKARNQKSVHHPVPEEALEVTREHIAQYQRFDELIHQLVEVSDTLRQARIRLQWDKKTSSSAPKQGSVRRWARKRHGRLKTCLAKNSAPAALISKLWKPQYDTSYCNCVRI